MVVSFLIRVSIVGLDVFGLSITEFCVILITILIHSLDIDFKYEALCFNVFLVCGYVD